VLILAAIILGPLSKWSMWFAVVFGGIVLFLYILYVEGRTVERRLELLQPVGARSPSTDLPLEDPLRSIRRFLRGFALVVTILAASYLILAVVGCSADSEEWRPVLNWMLFYCILGLPLIWYVIVVYTVFMPIRETGAFYLRSFRNDPSTWAIRVAIQEALGRGLRLSGVRDPRHRSFNLVDWFNPAFFAMRYCTPKFMDLEAGEDWRARLWNSMQRGHCVFIDVSDLTDFVLAEIRMAYECVGLGRILFVGDGSRDEAGWKALVVGRLPADADAAAVQLAVFTGRAADRPAFLEQIRDFHRQAQERPSVPLRRPPPWCGEATKSPLLRRKAVQYLLAYAGIVILFGIASRLLISAGAYALLLLWEVVGFFPLLIGNWAIYIREVGISFERRDASIGLAAVIAVSLAMFAIQIWSLSWLKR
jgi:hypothetical protein